MSTGVGGGRPRQQDATRAEIEGFSSEEMLQLVLDTIPQRVFWKDTDSVYVGCNRPLARDAGFDNPSDLIGRTDYEMSWKPSADLYRADDREVTRTGISKINYEEPQLRSDGSEGWLRTSKIPLRAADDRVIGVLCTYEDITERRALQEQLLQAQKVDGIGRLAGGVAHDFNNLLTAILGYVEMARLDLPADLPTDHVIRTDLDEIRAAGDRAATLTHQLLTFASKQMVTPVRLDLNELVVDLLKMLRPLLGENIAVETVLGPSIGTIEADPSQIQQLLVNLTVNARDAMPEGGRLTIETARENVTKAFAAAHPGARSGRHVRLSVTDTGCGISEEVRSHLFEPFFTTKERDKGTGLGLATCHGIVRKMGGHIRVSSRPGRGATFLISLPCVTGPATGRSSVPPASPIPTGTETILVVEDEPVVRRLAVQALRVQGYRVIEASDGVEALDIAQSLGLGIDLVVSDVIMPRVSGPELVKRLTAVAPGARRLLVSGHAESTVLPATLSDLAAAFLPKPFTPERLARKVREVLDAPAT
jgi:PAS domain S-box-containing protein